jgi:hypothetical protein
MEAWSARGIAQTFSSSRATRQTKADPFYRTVETVDYFYSPLRGYKVKKASQRTPSFNL